MDNNAFLVSFKKALKILDNEYKGLLKADILYEISKHRHPQSDEMKALEVYRNHLKPNSLFSHFHDLVLPAFKY
ncbi:hypothetical protein CVD25_22525 [Bacillus canaveralius]|uniref:Uncharacterized protein n=1 Tax=Bacillus canaveralius TaxID=1403243 RepID=A0A2N5GIB1_9BACI|nr:hypothetical protein CU635_17650 [Bacillus canaveralius]PLR88533.1 hypothetical protein CVD25_22525 [Bacillus canaveralius]